MWFWLWAKWCQRMLGYAIWDIGYDQSGVVMSKRVVSYEICDVGWLKGVGYEMWLWFMWVIIMRYVILVMIKVVWL